MTVQLIRYSTKLDKPEVVKTNPSDLEIREWLNTKLPAGEMTGILSDGFENTYPWGE